MTQQQSTFVEQLRQDTLDEAMKLVQPWVTQVVLKWASEEEYLEEAYEALQHLFGYPTPDVAKPPAETLAYVKQHIVDTVIEWAREAGYCDTATRPLDEVFGESPDKWLHSDGLDCTGYDAEGWRQAMDRDGVIREYDTSGKDREGFNQYGWDAQGYGRDGFNRQGYARDGYNRYGKDSVGRSRDPEATAQQILSTVDQATKDALAGFLGLTKPKGT